MKPEKTAPMSRKNVLEILSSMLPAANITIKDLHEKGSLGFYMKILHSHQNIKPNTDYDRVMGALLHFWKTS